MASRSEVAWGIGAGVPGGLTLMAWMFGEPMSVDLGIGLVVVCSVVAGVIRGRDLMMKIAFGVAFAMVGAGLIIATWLYTRNRTTIIKWELFIPAIGGMLPGAIAYFFLMDREDKQAKTVEEAGATREVSRPGAPSNLRGKIKFAAVSGEITSAGIEARRETGAVVLVMWRDVTAIVARRLPRQLDDVPFVDVVSPGATLRILPWTKLQGGPAPDDGVQRAREVLRLVAGHCPSANRDAETRAFDDNKPLLQLDVEALVRHDQSLA